MSTSTLYANLAQLESEGAWKQPPMSQQYADLARELRKDVEALQRFNIGDDGLHTRIRMAATVVEGCGVLEQLKEQAAAEGSQS